MRIGVAWVRNSNAQYRAIAPMNAMARRGHEIVWPVDSQGVADPRRLAGCDVVHVYRRADPPTQGVLTTVARSGTAIVYDNDDDLTAVPKESPDYKRFGGVVGQRLFTMSVKVARMARCFTTTSEALAEKYRQAGVERIEVIGNYVSPDIPRPRVPHDGLIIGWVAGIDHRADAARIPIADALRRVVEKHDHVRVECIGVDLGLPQRYRHDALVDFHELPQRIGAFDIGIAPLADIPCNHARSDIKLKEYAASGTPWLASPIGPYRNLGEDQGGRLVTDNQWFDALDQIITHTGERERLSRNAAVWARGQMMDAVADRWEQVLVGRVTAAAKSRSALGSRGAGPLRIRVRRIPR